MSCLIDAGCGSLGSRKIKAWLLVISAIMMDDNIWIGMAAISRVCVWIDYGAGWDVSHISGSHGGVVLFVVGLVAHIGQ